MKDLVGTPQLPMNIANYIPIKIIAAIMEIKKPKQFIIYTPQQWFINILNELEITSDANYIKFTNRYDGDTYVKYFKHSGIIVYSYGLIILPLSDRFNLTLEKLDSILEPITKLYMNHN